jgi:hypothetical protein
MFGSRRLIMVKRKTDWTPTMEQRAGLEGRQVKCLTASEGHLWMRDYHDQFPKAVRQRLAASPFNICAACLDIEVREQAQRGRETNPTAAAYLAAIARIERKLR